MSIFPNPSNGQFKVLLDGYVAYPLQLAVYDGQGTKVRQQLINSTETEVVLNNPRSGFYILGLTGDKINITKQVLIK